jgi:hypothetical protein
LIDKTLHLVYHGTKCRFWYEYVMVDPIGK